MNVNLYGCQGQWLMVDMGVTFADPAYPGVELMYVRDAAGSRYTKRNGMPY